jgi:NitT/TauT family transport system substrate-binding protein
VAQRCAQKTISLPLGRADDASRRCDLQAFPLAHRLLHRWQSWWLGFRLVQASGPRAAARERNFRVHGGTKAREASIARDWHRKVLPILEFATQPRGLRIMKRLLSFAAAFAIGLSTVTAAHAAPKKEFNIAWTIYVGWMPWPYAAESGIVKKWADKYGITINVTQINDYVESINQYTAGKFDGVTVTNMDALTIPAAGGVDTTAIIMGDYSNGNDGVVLKKGKSLADIKGQKVNLVELSVSHYLLARGLSTVKLQEKDIKTVNTSDADIVAASKSADTTAVVTWNPQLLEVKSEPGATLVFDSSKIPGEIEDLLVVKTETLKDNPNLAKALVGIWYETIALMKEDSDKGKAAREAMAKLSGTDLAGFEAQLKTTFMYYTAKDGAAFMTGGELPKIMDQVRGFCFEHNLLGEKVKSKDAVGIMTPTRTLGSGKNIKLRFDASYMTLAAEGKL